MKTRVLQTDAAAGSAVDPVRDAVIRTVGLSKQFGDISALRDLDLVVPRNAIVGFLGPNGAGKTTAIKLLLGLTRPSGGKATVFGHDSVRESLAVRARVGYLAQDPRFYPHMTARQTLEFAARFFYRGPRGVLQGRIDETLDLVGLADKADRPIKGFSGGERQRLGIAQAQINHPDLLILDEPAAALDPLGRRDVLDVMERLRAKTTIFYSTHILDDVERVSDQVVILDKGRLVASAATVDLLDGGGTSYQLTVRGHGQAARKALRRHAWVADVTTVNTPDAAVLTVRVSDEHMAESLLLPSVLAAGETVTSYGRRHVRLEDAFLRLLQENDR